MRILHYSLGFPPYRTGGLTKFCIDLIKQQIWDKNEVALMWPGKMQFLCNKTKIKDCGKIKIEDTHIQSYEIINPLPVSYDEGIKDIEKFIAKGNPDAFIELLEHFKPDVVHIHTLMGLHKCFLDEVKKKNIRLVFTSHDYFPICPKVTLFRNGNICSSSSECRECGTCNTTALSINKIRILQSSIYKKLKDSKLVKKIRKKHRDNYLGTTYNENSEVQVGNITDYKKLREYYGSMLKMIDIIHFNSKLTRNVYECVFGELPGIVIPISHYNISNCKRYKKFDNEIIRIRYLGPYGDAKGFFFLEKVLDALWNVRNDFVLDVHFKVAEVKPYMKEHRKYSYSDLENIFDETDILVAPSIWYETFGFTVLEALSYGVPVIISDTVGAKDILAKGAGCVFKSGNMSELLSIFKSLNKEQLIQMNNVIVKSQKIITLEEMANHIFTDCYR